MKKVNEHSGFNVPEGYFDTFTDRVFSKMEMEKVNSSENEDFKLPEGYFDTLTDKILLKVETEKEVPVRSLKRWYYAAASIAAILLMMLSFPWNKTANNNENILAITDIENYLELDGWGGSSYELTEMFLDNDLELSAIPDNQLDQESVIEYLSANIVDLEELNWNNDD